MSAAKLTPAQARHLAEIREAGSAGRKYNGRARRTVEALAAAGLITYDYDLTPHAIGAWTEVFHCYAIEITHRTKVVYGSPEGAEWAYTPSCSCGWVGTSWKSRDLAQASANGHFAFEF